MTAGEIDALRAAIAGGEPFIAFILPGDERLRLRGLDSVRIEPWGGCSGDMPVPELSTDKADYCARMASLIEGLRRRQGKAVVCRTICGNSESLDPAAIAEAYFPLFPATLRFLFRTPSGYWIGASPELLLDEDGDAYRTRALAGTRRAGTRGPWSEKNIAEHEFVVRDMTATLSRFSVAVDIGKAETLPYGPVEHLCTRILVAGDPGSGARIAAALHPTAAIAGYPRTEALSEIAAFETTARGYYTGTITIPLGPDRSLTYVILRTAHFDSHRWCVYTGSGITAASDPDDEWDETAAKAEPLVGVLSRSAQSLQS